MSTSLLANSALTVQFTRGDIYCQPQPFMNYDLIMPVNNINFMTLCIFIIIKFIYARTFLTSLYYDFALHIFLNKYLTVFVA